MLFGKASRTKRKAKAAADARSNAIEQRIKQDRLLAKNEISALLMSQEGSGQHELVMQMKLAHHGGYTNSERKLYREIIYTNVIQSIRAIIHALPTLELTLVPSNDVWRAVVLAWTVPAETDVDSDIFTSGVTDAIRHLWRDPAVQTAVKRSHEFHLNYSAAYFLDSIDRIATAGYLPTDQDILRSRVNTRGVTETLLKVGELTYRLLDVSGQRSDRRKWIHCFEKVTAIIFVVNLSDYDQTLDGYHNVNRLQESMALFDSLCNSRWFIKTSIIIFLNNCDIFAEKLPRSPLADHFPDYTGGDNYDAACDYLLHRFVSLNTSAAMKQIYTYYTCETDLGQMRFVLSAIQDILLQAHLREHKLLR